MILNRAAQTAAVAALIAGLTGCSATPTTTTAAGPAPATAPSMHAQLVVWRDGGGAGLFDSLGGDMRRVSDAGLAGDALTMGAACSTLQTDVEGAQAYAPMPDTEAQQHWAAMLALLARASSDCVSGTSTMSAYLITKSGGEIRSADDELRQTTTRIGEINGGGTSGT